MPLALPLLICLAAVLAPAPPAMAHGVFIYAWQEGSRICTESYFSRKSKVRGGTVIMAARDGTALGKGTSDDAGKACFDAPSPPRDLVVTVDAGPGHMGRFELPLAGVPAPQASAGHGAPAPEREVAAPQRTAPGASRTHEPPGPRDILGGIGIITGAATLVYWARARLRPRLPRK